MTPNNRIYFHYGIISYFLVISKVLVSFTQLKNKKTKKHLFLISRFFPLCLELNKSSTAFRIKIWPKQENVFLSFCSDFNGACAV